MSEYHGTHIKAPSKRVSRNARTAIIALAASAGAFFLTVAYAAAPAPVIGTGKITCSTVSASGKFNCQIPLAPTATATATPTVVPTTVPPTVTPTPSATTTPTISPTVSVSPSVTPSVPPTTTPPPTTVPPPSPTPGSCAAYPSVPTPACTGYAHTGVTLHDCTFTAAVTVYDSCRFHGAIVPTVATTISRSLILGQITYQTPGESLHGLVLTDVEIDGTNVGPGEASIGGWDWTCTRCHVHGGSRGVAVGDDGGGNVTVQDSYLGDWVSCSGCHETGLSGHGVSHIRIIHNWIKCNNLNDPTNFACSSAMAVYGDSAVNDDWLIQYNRFDSGSSYCLAAWGTPGKTYDYTNVRVTDNTFGDDFEAYWNSHDPGHAPHICSQYGAAVFVPSVSKGNVWTSNVDARGAAVVPIAP